MKTKEFLSITQVAKLLGLSRQAVHNKIKSGEIKAIKIGHTFGISRKEVKKIVGDVVGHSLSEKEKKELDKIIDRTIKEYGEVLRLLGKE